MTLMHSSDANGIEAEFFGWVDKWSFLRERLLIWVRAIFTRIWVFKRKCFELDDRERERIYGRSQLVMHGMAWRSIFGETKVRYFPLSRRDYGDAKSAPLCTGLEPRVRGWSEAMRWMGARDYLYAVRRVARRAGAGVGGKIAGAV